MNKKADGGLIALVVILIIIILIGVGINFGYRECSKDAECGEDSYCGSDFKCHEHPIIEKEIIKRDLTIPSIIMGIAIIVAALILKFPHHLNISRFRGKKKAKEHTKEAPHSTRLKP